MKDQTQVDSLELGSLNTSSSDGGSIGGQVSTSTSGRGWLYSSRRDILLFLDLLLLLLSVVSGLLVVILLIVYNKDYTSKNDVHIFEDTDWTGIGMRWQPSMSMNEDNCIERFRLANATIHCGVGELSPITNKSSNDLKLCGGVKMESNYCVMPVEGVFSSAQGEVSPLPRRFGINSIYDNNNTLPRCKTIEDFVNGTWQGNDFDQAEWIPNSCSAVPLNPFVWTKHTECKATITMIGDSHIRNLFTATVNGLRGIEAFAEAHADKSQKGTGVAEAYEWRLYQNDTATDHFSVYSNTKSNDTYPFKDCPCGEDVLRCLRIAFLWAPTFDEQLSQIDYVTQWKTDLVIASPGNSYEASTTLSPKWLQKFDNLLQEDKTLELGLLHFPWGNQPADDRKGALTSWTTKSAFADRVSYLQQSEMTPTIGGQQGFHTFHFSCRLTRVDIENDKIEAAEPCVDLADTAQIR